MKPLKIVAIAVFAVMAVALVTTSAYAFHLDGFGTTEETVSSLLSYPVQPSVTTPATAPTTAPSAATSITATPEPPTSSEVEETTSSSTSYAAVPVQTYETVCPAIVYGAEPVLTTASAVTSPIYYPICCSSWYGYDACYDDGYYYGCGGCGGRGHGGYYGYGTAPIYGTTTALTINQAVTVANEYLTSLNNLNLAIANVQEYAVNFRFTVYEKTTGVGAYEMTINKYTGYVYPGMGPSLIWNTKYGIINGAITVYNATATSTMPVTAAQAQSFAQQYLSTALPATTVGTATPFYGYYNVEVLSGGNLYGIVSVNGCTGQIWYQAWHGAFIQQATS
jgi:hypothetical protein